MTLKQLEAALSREYRWRKGRYAESETGLRSNGGNCFNEAEARRRLDALEEAAEAAGVDWRAIRNEIYSS